MVILADLVLVWEYDCFNDVTIRNRNDAATLCCAKNRRCESSRVVVCRLKLLYRDTQRLFSIKYLLGEANIAQNFLLLGDG